MIFGIKTRKELKKEIKERMNMNNSVTITREEFTKAVNATIDFLKSQNIEASQTLFCSYLSDVLFEDVKADVQEVKLEPFTDNE